MNEFKIFIVGGNFVQQKLCEILGKYSEFIAVFFTEFKCGIKMLAKAFGNIFFLNSSFALEHYNHFIYRILKIFLGENVIYFLVLNLGLQIKQQENRFNIARDQVIEIPRNVVEEFFFFI